MELEEIWEIQRKIVELAMPLFIDECMAYIQFHGEKAIKDMTDDEIARIVRYICPNTMNFTGCVNANDIAKVITEIKRTKE